MDATPRRAATRRGLTPSVFAETTIHREATILLALGAGVRWTKKLRNRRERDFCAAMRPAVNAMRARGEGVDMRAYCMSIGENACHMTYAVDVACVKQPPAGRDDQNRTASDTFICISTRPKRQVRGVSVHRR